MDDGLWLLQNCEHVAGNGGDDALRVRLEVPHACKRRRVLDGVLLSQHYLEELKPFTRKFERRRSIARVCACLEGIARV